MVRVVRVIIGTSPAWDVIQNRPQRPERQTIQDFQLRPRHFAVAVPGPEDEEDVPRRRSENEGVHASAQRRTVDQDHVVVRPQRRDEGAHGR